MTVKQLFELADARSHFVRTARPELIWLAITESARQMYFWIKKENQGFFIKWDTGTIVFAAGTDEYACPADLDQIVRFSERQNAQDKYREILPSGINAPLFKQSQFDTVISTAGVQMSDFSYIGPYFPAAATDTIELAAVQKVRIAPPPSEARQTELIYSAKFVEMARDEDLCVIPPDGRGALLEYAVASLVRGKNDALADSLEKAGDKMRELYLTSVRDRQIQQYTTVQPYLDQLD